MSLLESIKVRVKEVDGSPNAVFHTLILPNGTLTDNGDGTATYTAAASGQTLFETIVATSGGDYTTLGAALAAGKTRIFIRNGTYAESAISNATADIHIVGESHAAVIAMAGNAFTLSGANAHVEGLKLTTSGGLITFSGAAQEIVGNHFVSTGTTTALVISSSARFRQNYVEASATANGDAVIDLYHSNSVFQGNYVELSAVTTAAAINIASTYSRNLFTDNFVRCSGASNDGIVVAAAVGLDHTIFSDNNFYGAGGAGSAAYALDISAAAAGSDVVVTGNYFSNWDRGFYSKNFLLLTVTGNQFATVKEAIYLDGDDGSVVSGNVIHHGSTGGTGITLANAAINNNIAGNTIYDVVTSISIAAASKYNTIVGNNLSTFTTAISDSGVANTAMNNVGAPNTSEKRFVRMKNTSGGTLVQGDSVTMKAVAAGDEFTTTTTQGDDKILGMVDESIANNAYGFVQVLGKTVALKVNGTTDIAIGDLLGTFTAAGIAMKASAGDQVFAMALEAYITDDSNGVIDALLITPRLI